MAYLLPVASQPPLQSPEPRDWASPQEDIHNESNDNGIPSAELPSAPNMSYPRRDISFYLNPVTFQVGNTLFKVDKGAFQVPGSIFETMFSLPTGSKDPASSAPVEGEGDDNPIYLHGVDESKFRSFLTVLFRPQSVSTDEETLYHTYINALELATLWDFKKLRKEIISMLSPIITQRSNVEIIFVAKKHRVSAWLRAAYKKLVQSCGVLPAEELVSSKFNLDWATIAKIYIIRDAIARQAMDNSSCSQCGQSSGPNYGQKHELKRYSCECRVEQFINNHFNEELEMLKEEPLDSDLELGSGKTRNDFEGHDGKLIAFLWTSIQNVKFTEPTAISFASTHAKSQV